MRHQRRVVGLHVPFRKINLRFMWKTGESQRTDRAMKARHQSSRGRRWGGQCPEVFRVPPSQSQITEGCANQCLSMPLFSSAVPGRWQVLRKHTMSKWVSVC